MPKLPRVTGKRLGKVLEKLGFSFTSQTGSHAVYRHADGRVAVVPMHSGEEIGPGLLLKIIKKDLGMQREDFEKLI